MQPKITQAAAVFLLVASALSLSAATPALADHDDPFIQVTCSPELDYFFIRTFHVQDTKAWGDNDRAQEIEKAIIKNGIYSLKDFTEANYHCALPTRDILFKLERYVPTDKGKCDENNAKFNIKINGEEAYSFNAFGERCDHISHQITFSRIEGRNGYDKSFINDCVYPEGDSYLGNTLVEAACKNIKSLTSLDK